MRIWVLDAYGYLIDSELTRVLRTLHYSLATLCALHLIVQPQKPSRITPANADFSLTQTCMLMCAFLVASQRPSCILSGTTRKREYHPHSRQLRHCPRHHFRPTAFFSKYTTFHAWNGARADVQYRTPDIVVDPRLFQESQTLQTSHFLSHTVASFLRPLVAVLAGTMSMII